MMTKDGRDIGICIALEPELATERSHYARVYNTVSGQGRLLCAVPADMKLVAGMPVILEGKILHTTAIHSVAGIADDLDRRQCKELRTLYKTLCL